MSLFDKLLGRKPQPPRQRIRVCVECGMPVEEHKDWCAIFQGQKEMAHQSLCSSTGIPHSTHTRMRWRGGWGLRPRSLSNKDM